MSQSGKRADFAALSEHREIVSSVALALKALREQAVPRLTIRGLADRLGMPLSSYSRYETPAKFKRAHLPIPLAREIARILADHGVPPAAVMALATHDEEVSLPALSAAQEGWLEMFERLTQEQRILLQQIAEQMAPQDVACMPSGTMLHGGRSPYRGPGRRSP